MAGWCFLKAVCFLGCRGVGGARVTKGNPPSLPPLTACSCRARSFFSWVTLTWVSSSSWRLASAAARAPRSPRSSARRAASSSSACAERSSGFILKKSFIQDQFLTALKARIFHWMVNRASLDGGGKPQGAGRLSAALAVTAPMVWGPGRGSALHAPRVISLHLPGSPIGWSVASAF